MDIQNFKHYNLSKEILEALALLNYKEATKVQQFVLPKALSKKDIRVNAVAPGPVWTPLIPSTIIDYKDFGKDTALKRPGQPVEIAPIYVFLASNEASYIGGITIPATGGKIAY